MCGIAGCLVAEKSRRNGELHRQTEGMVERLVHRGPDDGGVWTDVEAGVALGSRRLAIIDLSPLGHQPMHSPCGRYTVVFNGEIYNFLLLRKELEAAGRLFRGRSDTEVLLAAVAEWGIEGALPRLNGMFAFAIWEHATRRLWLARDRLGEKPLYFGWARSTFLFGSELKALRAHPDFQNDVNPNVVALYMRYGYVPAPYSIYRDVYKLPPGTYLQVSASECGTVPRPVPYWSALSAAEQPARHPAEGQQMLDEVEHLLRDAVRLRMIADVPLGVFLSGGIDSSLVVALMQAESTSPVRTFTIGFREASYNEADHAKEVAHQLGTNHTELYATAADALAVIDRLAEVYDEPFADSSQIPTLLVAALARRHVTVALSGDGGDELFGGYNRYRWGRALWHFVRALPPPVQRALRGIAGSGGRAVLLRWLDPWLARTLSVHDPSERLDKMPAILEAATADHLYLNLLSNWTTDDALVHCAYEPPTALTDRQLWLEDRDFAAQAMFVDIVSYLPDDLLVKLDRASMSVGLEARVPLLDHRIVEFALRVPVEMKLRDGRGKWLTRQLLYKYIPRHLVDRPKRGFAVPIGTWLRGPLRGWAESLLDADLLKRQGFLNPGIVRERWNEHVSHKRNWQYHLWNVLMFQAWLRPLQ